MIIPLSETDNSKNPLFLLPPITGVPTIFRNLASFLQARFRVFGIQYYNFCRDFVYDDTLEQMVNRLLKEVVDIQEDGTYLLIGYSMGATIAYEMAKQLESRGAKVELLLIDGCTQRKINCTINSLTEREKIKFEKKFNRKLKKQLPDDVPACVVKKIESMLQHNSDLLYNYEQNTILESDLTVFEAESGMLKADMSKWEEFTTGMFKHYDIKGNHFTLLEPENIPETSQIILDVLLQYQETEGARKKIAEPG